MSSMEIRGEEGEEEEEAAPLPVIPASATAAWMDKWACKLTSQVTCYAEKHTEQRRSIAQLRLLRNKHGLTGLHKEIIRSKTHATI